MPDIDLSEPDYRKEWSERAAKLLVGRRIVAAHYTTDEERDELGWDNHAIVLELDDGTLLYPSKDDEGNNAGALFTSDDNLPTIPVI